MRFPAGIAARLRARLLPSAHGVRPRLVAPAAALLVIASLQAQQPPARFRSGVELINVTATVSDADGRFVPNLTQDDFVLYDDDRPVDIAYFSADRVPVSLGIALDTSGSMAGDKINAAREAIARFVNELLDRNDELFLYRFSNYPVLVQGWTRDRRELLDPLDRLTPNGATAMYDAVAKAIPLAAEGQNRKKAIVVISDGNDTSSQMDIRDLKEQIRLSEVLVYAVGIDGDDDQVVRRAPLSPRLPVPAPRRFPGGPFGGVLGVPPPPPPPPVGGSSLRSRFDDRVNVAALREMTDDSGGRTEIVRAPHDLDPATASIADELSKQYSIGYPSPGGVARWHSIRVEVKNHAYRVRARRGYFAN